MKPSKKVAYYGIFAALAILMGYVEMLIPVVVAVPGIKLGLANVIVLIALYFMGTKAAFFISFIRIFIVGLLFAGFAGLLYSLAGAGLSFFVMIFMKKIKVFSIIGVSAAGGIFHNIGQIVLAALVVNNIKLFYYLPILLISGIITGIVTGIVAKYCLFYLDNQNFL